MISRLKKTLASCTFVMTLLLSQGAFATPLSEILSVNTHELSSSEYQAFIEQLNAAGSVMMTNVHTLSNDWIMPGDMTPEQGLDYIPNDDNAIDIYIELIEQGALPFGAVLITNQILFDLWEETSEK